MSLAHYQRKRAPNQTPEPFGGRRKQGRPIFVVQLHHASRRHYDFRLQVGDVLKSWAVPKGPSYDPSVKRMAVGVEDHPLDYASFEGAIPKGQYGGGHVSVFDHGYWTTDGDVQAQLAKGHLQFELYGDKLKGGWHLVRTHKPAKQPQWLLFKAADAYAGNLEADDLLGDVTPPPAEDLRRAGAGKTEKLGKHSVALPKRRARNWAKQAEKLTGARKAAIDLNPHEMQLAKLGHAPPVGDKWLHELKWDGYRLMALVDGKQIKILSRNDLPWADRVPEVRDALLRLNLRSAIFDGELIAGRGTRADFNLLQQVLSGGRQGHLNYAIFDLLYIDSVDISQCALLDRKVLLASILANPPPHLALSSHSMGNGEEAYRVAIQAGFEGIISKRADHPYVHGRSDDWRKTKALESEDYAVVGYTPPKGSRSGIGALLLATPDAEHGWRYVGRVGSGFNHALLSRLGNDLMGTGDKTPSVFVAPHGTDLRAALWIAPKLVVEVFTRGIGGHGLLRQASFKTVREDKTIMDLIAEAQQMSNIQQPPASDSKRSSSVKTLANSVPVKKSTRALPAISSGEKRLFPQDGITKQQVVDYYAAVMDWLLPEIQGRPLSVVRCPSGIGAQCFFQKHATPGMELIALAPLREESGTLADYIVVTDAASIIELVQFNALEFHPWGALATTPEIADRIVFDLDPDTDVAWAQVVAAAREVRALLQQTGLQSFVRTSGGKGLHVVVPLSPGNPWSIVKPFAHAFAESMAQMDPLKYVASATKKFRKNKIFVDYLRNGRGATSIASFSLRARPGAPVAMPLRWEELGKISGGNAFTLQSAQRRLKRLKQHPWGDFHDLLQNLDGLDFSG